MSRGGLYHRSLPLVKTALFASDPNWGRLLAAIGRAGLKDLQVDAVSLFINDVLIAVQGARAPDYTEASGQAAMAADELVIRVELNRGDASCRSGPRISPTTTFVSTRNTGPEWRP